MGKRKKKVLSIIASTIIIMAVYFLIPYLMNYEKPETIKSEVKDYLSKKYQIEFAINEPEYTGNAWEIYANPINGQKTDTFVQWKKSAVPHITYDSYIDDRLRLQALPKTEQYFKDLYGEDTQIFFLFQCMDDKFLKSAEAKTIDLKDEVKQQKKNNYMEVQCYVFEDKKQKQSIEEQDAKKAINECLDQAASEWQYDVFYLSEDYKDEFIRGYSKDFNFLRLKDSEAYKKMHKRGQLLDWFTLSRMKDEPLPDVSYGFFFPEDANAPGKYIAYDKLPADYDLKDAKADGCVVFEDLQLTAGAKVWKQFLKETQAGKPANVRLAWYYTLDSQNLSKDYSAEVKDEYPVLYIQDLSYDGENYHLYYTEGEKVYTYKYPYLVKYTGKPDSSTAAYREYVRYYLVRDKSITYKQIEISLLTSYTGNQVDCVSVYTDLKK